MGMKAQRRPEKDDRTRGATTEQRLNAEGMGTHMCVSFLGTIKRSLPTRALPVALTLFSPLAVSGMSLTPVCLPLRDHSVSPWRTMKTRGVAMIGFRYCCGPYLPYLSDGSPMREA